MRIGGLHGNDFSVSVVYGQRLAVTDLNLPPQFLLEIIFMFSGVRRDGRYSVIAAKV